MNKRKLYSMCVVIFNKFKTPTFPVKRIQSGHKIAFVRLEISTVSTLKEGQIFSIKCQENVIHSFNCERVVHHEFISKYKTDNQQYYLNMV